MSWELMNTIKKECSCGNGHITEYHYMDDWNRTKEDVYCDCKYCNDKKIKEQNRIKEMRATGEKVVSYFIIKYLDQWANYFQDKKSKKSIWEAAQKMELERCSLSTFYSDYRSLPITEMTRYYKSLVRINNMPKIIQTLNIQDSYIESELPELLKFYEEERRKSYNDAYEYFRKKR